MSFTSIEQNVVSQTIEILGRDVTYNSVGYDPVEIKGVFDNSFVDVEGIVSLKPTLRINLQDLSASPAKGDTVEINSVVYNVLESREDGFGGSTLILHED